MIDIKKYYSLGFLAIIIVVAGCLISSLNSCYYDKSDLLYPDTACDTSAVKYSTSVLPILSSNCISCHGGSTPSAGISLDTYAGVKIQADNGRLWGAVSHSPNYSPMPKNSNQLNTCNLEKIRIWVAAGSPNN
jgi:hypothetical protein